MATSSGLMVQICLIIALSFRCRFFLVSCQVSLAWSMALSMQELYTWPRVTQVAEGSCHLQLIWSNLDFILWPAVNRAGISHAQCTPIIKIWCQSLWPTAILMHPKFAAIAVDAVVAYSCTTNSAWVFT